jgi:hypothetical protein
MRWRGGERVGGVWSNRGDAQHSSGTGDSVPSFFLREQLSGVALDQQRGRGAVGADSAHTPLGAMDSSGQRCLSSRSWLSCQDATGCRYPVQQLGVSSPISSSTAVPSCGLERQCADGAYAVLSSFGSAKRETTGPGAPCRSARGDTRGGGQPTRRQAFSGNDGCDECRSRAIALGIRVSCGAWL